MPVGPRPNNLRKLAALDIVFLGYPLILIEFACGVFLSLALGIFVLYRGHSFWQLVLGAYLICLGINYLPMLLYTISIGGRTQASAELGDELSDRKAAMSKYRKLSLLLLVPLAPAIIAAGHGLRLESASREK